MNRYLLITSRDPFTCGTTPSVYALARDFQRKGYDVALFLVENGVLAARDGASCPALDEALALGVRVYADDFSLRQRAIGARALVTGVTPRPLDYVMDAIADGTRTIWH